MAETDCEKRLVNQNDKKKRSADLCVHMGRASMVETDREKRLVNRNNKKMRLEELKIGKTEEELDYEREFSELVHKETLKLYKEMKKERAERLQEYMKEPWPPVWKPIHESIHYKCGLISSFVNDSWGILCMNEIDFKSHPAFAKWANDADCLKKMQAFFKLVLNSRGYDVDCRPPKPLYSPYYPIRVDKVSTSSKYYTEILYPLMKCVAQRINIRAKDFGESFKPPYKIKKYVEALTHLKCLITFSGELFSRGRFVGVMDVQAMLHMEGGTEYECVEWRYKREDKNWPRDRTLLFSKMRRPRSTYSHSNAVVAAPAADSELPKTNTNTEAKTKTETVEKKGAVKTIIIEHGEYYMSFRIWADRVKEAVKRDFPGVSVVINPKGPRRNSFEIREEGGEVFVSMLDMSRPFMAFRALDKEKLIADILEKIR